MFRPRFHGLHFIGFALLALTVAGGITMTLWNNLIPGIFHLTAINFWQALGLLALSRLFFGGFHGRTKRSGFGRARFVRGWNALSPEDRESFRAAMERCDGGKRWHFGPSAEER